MRYSDLEYYVDFIHVFIIPDNFEHIQEFYCRIRLRNDAPNEDTLHLFYDCPSTESIRDEFFRWAYCEEGNYTISTFHSCILVPKPNPTCRLCLVVDRRWLRAGQRSSKKDYRVDGISVSSICSLQYTT